MEGMCVCVCGVGMGRGRPNSHLSNMVFKSTNVAFALLVWGAKTTALVALVSFSELTPAAG